MSVSNGVNGVEGVRKVRIDGHPGDSTSTLASTSSLSIPSTSQTAQAQANRVRALSVASTSASSIASSGVVSEKRQNEFYKHFQSDLEPVLDDSFDVLATQSCDLQSSVLIHGRLYLTRHHLCFRANILGIVTKKVHPLKNVVGLEKGTTAKWIQNAIYVYIEGEEKYFGYGSLGDRDAMYDDVLAAWQEEAPERYTEAEKVGRIGMSKVKSSKEDISVSSTSSLSSSNSTLSNSKEEASREKPSKTTADNEVKHTECKGDHYKEVVADEVIGLPLEEVFNLVYRNGEFTKMFYEDCQKLKDVDISDWSKVDQGEERTMKYVMSVNNPIGPNETDCHGKETIVVNDPEKSIEILSETNTPGLPAGKSFQVKTRTCLTHTDKKGKPATRMFATSQCDWSSFSMLKSTITPAVIKGQKSYHEKLVGAIRKWVKEHPTDFADQSSEVTDGGDTKHGLGSEEDVGAPREKREGGIEGGDPDFAVKTVQEDKSLVDHTMEIPNNPVMLGVSLLCLLFLIREIYWWT